MVLDDALYAKICTNMEALYGAKSMRNRFTLNEAIYGGLATIFHRSKTPGPKLKISVGAARDGVSIFGGGMYTTYELEDQLNDRMIRNYGEYLFKIVARVDEFFIFDKKLRDERLSKLTTEQRSAIVKIEDIVKDDEDFNDWHDTGSQIYVINKYPEIDDLIRGHFGGMIYKSKDDGRCALIFNPSKTFTKVVGVAHVPTPTSEIIWKKL